MNNGGPAFPTKCPALDPREVGFYTNEGMTLRDYFAAVVASGYVMQGGSISKGAAQAAAYSIGKGEQPKPWAEIIAGASYAVADAMLAEREKGQQQ